MKNLLQATYTRLDRLSGRVTKGLEAISGLLIFTCFLTLIFQVLYRFVLVKFFVFSFPFTEEFARYLLIWTVYLLAGVNLREGTMVAVNFIYDRLHGKARAALYCFTRILMFVFLSVAFVVSLQVVAQNVEFRSSTLRAPGWLLYSAPAIGIVFLSVETLVETIGVFAGAVAPFGLRHELDGQRE